MIITILKQLPHIQDHVRNARQIDRSDDLLDSFNEISDHEDEPPLHIPTGEKTRKTYDFTGEYFPSMVALMIVLDMK